MIMNMTETEAYSIGALFDNSLWTVWELGSFDPALSADVILVRGDPDIFDKESKSSV